MNSCATLHLYPYEFSSVLAQLDASRRRRHHPPATHMRALKVHTDRVSSPWPGCDVLLPRFLSLLCLRREVRLALRGQGRPPARRLFDSRPPPLSPLLLKWVINETRALLGPLCTRAIHNTLIRKEAITASLSGNDNGFQS